MNFSIVFYHQKKLIRKEKKRKEKKGKKNGDRNFDDVKTVTTWVLLGY